MYTQLYIVIVLYQTSLMNSYGFAADCMTTTVVLLRPLLVSLNFCAMMRMLNLSLASKRL